MKKGFFTLCLLTASLLFVQGQEKVYVETVGPLLKDIAFDQGAPYSNNTPVVKGYNCPTGCVATAMAQIMAFYQYPKECHGSISYTTESLNIKVNKNLEGYKPDWENILPTYTTGNYTSKQGEAIADLMSACGAAVHMDYNWDGSGALSEDVPGAMSQYFGFDVNSDFVIKSDYTDAQYHEMLQNELRAGRPIYYSSTQQVGAGHAFVCDGFRVQEGYEKYPEYHFNWGWGGDANDWVRLNKLAAKITIAGEVLDISYNQKCILKLHPSNWTSIEETEAAYDSNAPIYDIFGRRVAEPVPGQIYIQNGKKFYVME